MLLMGLSMVAGKGTSENKSRITQIIEHQALDSARRIYQSTKDGGYGDAK